MLNWITGMLLSLSVSISQNTEKVVLPVGHTIDYDFSEEERCPHCSGHILFIVLNVVGSH